MRHLWSRAASSQPSTSLKHAAHKTVDKAADILSRVRDLTADHRFVGIAAGGAAKNLLILAESYPALRASQTFQGLLAELVDAENQVYARRIAFNEAIRAFNTQLGQFPNVIVGRAMGFASRSYETAEQNL